MSEKWLPCRQEWLRLYRRVRSLTRRDDAEDHLQSAFVNYLERPDGSIGHPEAYITRSAVNLSHNARRREQVGCIAPGGWDDMLGEVRDTAPTEEEAYQARERLIRFHAGCQHYEEGYYTAWRNIANEPIDFVFHYGDYIYEGPDSKGRVHEMNGRPFQALRRHVGPECYSLDEYRRRYAQYKTDPDLQAAHAAVPWIVTSDDHEVDNNWAGDTDQDGTPPEIFRLRRQAAMQAYYEHMPPAPFSPARWQPHAALSQPALWHAHEHLRARYAPVSQRSGLW